VAELVPVPLHVLLRRAHHELRRRRAIFDLPERTFRQPPLRRPGARPLVPYAGTRAASPIGPAAGPHTQLARISRSAGLPAPGIFELKTIQVNDRLSLSRPCIDMATIGYQHEWSAGADARGVAQGVREGVHDHRDARGERRARAARRGADGERREGTRPLRPVCVRHQRRGTTWRVYAAGRWRDGSSRCGNASAVVTNCAARSPMSSRGFATTRSGRAWLPVSRSPLFTVRRRGRWRRSASSSSANSASTPSSS